MVHVQTIINTVFAEVDEDGNLYNEKPIQIKVPKLNEEQFLEALKVLQKAKAEGGVVGQ